MRRDAQRSLHQQDLAPQVDAGNLPTINHAQVRRAFSAWLKKRGFREEAYGDYRFGKNAQTKSK
jgi:hypothetical protein